MKDSFVFYRSFFEAIKDLDDKKRLKMFDSITKFALENEENDNLNGICKQLFVLIKPQIIANNKRFENGKKGGRPPKEKTNGFLEKKPNENVNENVNENFNEETEEATTPTENLLLNWHGFYKNVHLTSKQYGKLLSEIANQSALDELIEDLSSNIAQKKEKSPPYDDKFPDMHFAMLKAYWKYRKLNGFKKPIPKEDKAAVMKSELEKLTQHFRQKETESG